MAKTASAAAIGDRKKESHIASVYCSRVDVIEGFTDGLNEVNIISCRYMSSTIRTPSNWSSPLSTGAPRSPSAPPGVGPPSTTTDLTRDR